MKFSTIHRRSFFQYSRCVIVTLLMACAVQSQTIIYVSKSAPPNGQNNGKTWFNAYRELRDALNDPAIPLATQSAPVEVWIAKGTYKPTTNLDRTASFTLRSNLRLRGGFAGSETALGSRSLANIAVLSGDIGQPEINSVTPGNFLTVGPIFTHQGSTNIDPGYLDNSYNVLSGNRVTNVILDTLVVANGVADAPQAHIDVLDMAIPNTNGDLTLEAPNQQVMGAGLYLNGGQPLALDQIPKPTSKISADVPVTMQLCFFVNNIATGYGGAVANINESLLGKNCTFQGNVAGQNGGALWSWHSYNEWIECQFSDNDATLGGAIAFQKNATTNDITGAPGPVSPSDLVSRINFECYQGGQFAMLEQTDATDPDLDFDAVDKLEHLDSTVGKVYGGNDGVSQAELEALDNGETMNTKGLMDAIGYVEDAIQFGDAVAQFAIAFGGDTNNAAYQGWTEFTDDFNLYATPNGWATLAVTAFIDKYGPAPSLSQEATETKELEQSLYNPANPSLLINCQFNNNIAYRDGGAVYITYDNVQMEDCDFSTNSASNGGGIAANGFTTPIIMNCAFLGNHSSLGHSAISSALDSRTQIINCTLVGNTANTAEGFCVGNDTGSDVRICNSILWNNTNATNDFGGADVETATKATLNAKGRAAYDSAGPGYVDFIAMCDIRNSIVQSLQQLPAGNDGVILFPAATLYSTLQVQEVLSNYAVAQQTGLLESYGFVDIGEGFRPGLTTTNGNLSIDPMLINGIYPATGSQAIDAGNNVLINGPVLSTLTGVDVFGQNRFIGQSVDIGAIEYQHPPSSSQLYVNQRATGNNSGSSWANAMTNLQKALSISKADIWVAAGTYLPTLGSDRTATFTLAEGVQVYGGFLGNETQLSQRNPSANATILSGNIGNPNNDADNSYNVVTAYNVSANTLLDGFTITKGRGQYGSGISIANSSLTVNHCLFIDNQSQEDGGAVYASGQVATPEIDNCRFISNSASGGGAVATQGPLYLANCTFQWNQAASGGAVWSYSAPVSIYNGLFVSNLASASGGAIFARGGQSLQIYNSTFFQNSISSDTSAQGGGAVDASVTSGSLTVANSIFWQNEVTGSAATTENQQVALSSTDTSVGSSLIQGLSLYTGNGNINADPLFVDPEGGDFTLNAYSPAVDAGANLILTDPNYPPADLAGNARWLNATIDMGAYEFTGVPQSLSTIITVAANCSAGPGTQILSLYSNSPATSSYQWLVDRQDENGFVILANDAIHSGATTPTLEITSPPLSMNGWKYELTGHPNFISEAVTLNATLPVIYVKAGATGSGSGLDWADAYPNLQQAIDNAGPCTQIWVAAGTYTPAGIAATNAFQLRPYVKLYGGFAGTETSLSQRNWATNVTVLNGNQTNLGTQLQNVVVANASEPGTILDSNVVLDGFTIMGSSGSSVAELNLGLNHNPTIQNCVFIVAQGTAPLTFNGAAQPTPTNCWVAQIPGGLCNPQLGATFTVSSTGAASAYTWQVNTGSGFVPIGDSPVYSGLFQINGSMLVLQSIPALDLNDQFQFSNTVNGYTSPAIGLYFGAPTVIYVNATAVGQNDGSSWADAYSDLTTAIQAAGPCAQIWVAAGTYTPNTNISASFMLNSGVAVYGGFSGTESTLNQRNWLASPTYLRANGQNTVVYCDGTGQSSNGRAILDGFWFAGQTDMTCVNIESASPTVQNCIFTNNQGVSLFTSSASPLITACEFLGNRATAIESISASPQISSCVFSNNSNVNDTRAVIYDTDGSSVTANDCIFANNSCNLGAGLYVESASAALARCSFIGNTSRGGGSAVFVSAGGTLTAQNSLFARNNSSFPGGAIAYYGKGLELYQCTIADNSAYFSGGGVYLHGANAFIQNSILWNNTLYSSSITNQQQAQVDAASGTLGLDSCIIQNLGSPGATNCTAYDPLFAKQAGNDYGLTAHSPAIAIGNPNNPGNSGTVDLAGASRFIDGHVDRGAYEFQSTQESPISLLTQPATQSVCEGNQVTFTIGGVSSSNYNYQWQTNSGFGFEPTPFQITTISNISTLTIPAASLALDGTQFRVTIGDYASPAATLTVLVPDVLYVNPHAIGATNGLSWTTAFSTIQDALAAADACTEIWVAKGTYYQTNSAGSPLSLQMKAGVRIYGGFVGTETNLTQRNWALNPTILQAVSSAPVVNNDGTYPVDLTAALDGFVLTGGKIGMFNAGASPRIDNCVFERFSGNAIINGYQSAPIIRNCSFLTNNDSAIYNFQSLLTISNCVFSGNQSQLGGAAIYSFDSSVSGVGLTFNTNSTRSGGGAIYLGYGSLMLSRCSFNGNLAENGGGLDAFKGTYQIDNSIFANNIGAYDGGALEHESGTGQLINCTIVQNRAIESAGGGIFMEAGSLNVANTVLWNNSAGPSNNVSETGQIDVNGGMAQISWSCLQGLSAFAGNNNVAYDPVFMNEPAGNFRLTPSFSPLLGVGNAALGSISALDVEGNSRSNYQGQVDMGAYEQLQQVGEGFKGKLLTLQLPSSQNICDGGNAVFLVQTPSGIPSNIVWYAVPPGYGQGSAAPPEDIPTNFGNLSVVVTNGLTEVIVQNVGPAQNGFTFFFDDLSSGYASPVYQLTTVEPGVLYVNASANPAGQTGGSWATAYTSLQSALTAATPCTQIWVAKGTYVPVDHGNGVNSFTMESGVSVLGGFNGAETNAAQRNWTNNPTTLAGAGSGPTLYSDSQLIPADSSAVLDGFTVTGGGGNPAMYNYQTSAQIRHCRFVSNSVVAVNNEQASPSFDSCAFVNNSQGAVINSGGATPVFTNCSFVGNSTPGGGAAIYNLLSSPLVVFSSFIGNSAGYGGAVYDSSANAIFLDCVFSNNSAQFGEGGAYESDGASTSQLLNCLMAYNSAFVGSGLAFGGSNQQMINCTVAENQSSGTGGAVIVSRGNLAVLNSILWGNSDKSGSGLEGQLYDAGGNSVVSNSIVEGWTGQGGSLPYDPLFVDPYHGNFHLTNSSPALQVGNTNYDTNIAVDLDGNPRVFSPQQGYPDVGENAGAYSSYLLDGDQSGQTPAEITQSPMPQTTCIGDTVSFTIEGTNSGGYPAFHWGYNAGSGWVYLNPGSDVPMGDGLSETYTLTESSYSSTLTISGVVAAMNGYQFQAMPVDFNGFPPPVTLTVNNLQVIYLNPTAPANGDGTSWATAYHDLPTAITNITSCRRVIWAAAGTYPVTSQISVPEATEIYGGFIGTETNLNQRNWQLNKVVLTGLVAGPGLPAVLSLYGNNPAADNQTVLDGIVFSNNVIGVSVDQSSPAITNCVFIGNGYGLSLSDSDAIVDHCQFYDNFTNAISMAGNAVIRYSVFAGNVCAGGAGSVIKITSGNPQIINSLITGNEANAILAGSGVNATVNYCTIADNTSSVLPAGIYGGVSGTVNVYDSIVWGNRSSGYSVSDAQSSGTDVSVADSTFESDGATDDPLFINSLGATAAPFVGGDYHLQLCSPAYTTNNDGLFAIEGGILADLDGSPRYVNGVLDYGAYEVQLPPAPPVEVISQPVSLTYCSIGSNSFAISAAGTNLTYQWQRNANDGLGFVPLADGTNFSGSRTANLLILSASQLFNQNGFRCLVTSGTGCTAVSQPAILTVEPTVWYVNAQAPAGGDGTSWSNAFTTLDAALNNTAFGGCTAAEVWVAAGVYTPAATLQLSNGIAIYGGFHGNETNLNQRNWTTNATILQGNNDIILQALDTHPINDTKLDGLIFTKGSTAVSLTGVESGSIAHCIFISNAIPIALTGSAQSILNCSFLWNAQPTELNQGGPQGDTVPYSSADIENCRFQANIGVISAAGSFQMVNCVVSGNGSDGSAAIYADLTSHPVLVNCTVAGNNGGGCDFEGNGFELYNSIFWNNSRNGEFDENSQVLVNTLGIALGNDIQNAVNWAIPSVNNTNFSADPGFVDDVSPASAPSTNGNFALSPCSPLINIGLNAYAPGNGIDIESNPRIYGGTLDLGAFEYQGIAELPHLISQSGNQSASFATPAAFSVKAATIPGATLTYQWYGPSDAIPGATNASLTLSNVSADMNGNQYYCQIMNGACGISSTPVTLGYVDVVAENIGPTFGNSPVSLDDPIHFTLGPDLSSNTVSSQSVIVQGFQSGLIPVTASVSGSVATLYPASPYFPGEDVEVSATTQLGDQSNLHAQPYVWEFTASVPNSNSMQFFGQTIASSSTFSDVVVGDFNSDGRLDILAFGSGGAGIWTNDGMGQLVQGQLLTGNPVVSVRAADVNQDGRLDVLMLGTAGKVSVWLNQNGSLVSSGFAFGTGVETFAIGDLNGDGSPDVFLAGSGPAQVWLNNGNGTFSDSGERLGVGGSSVVLGDLNHDGAIDALVVGNAGQSNQIWFNNPNGQFTEGSQSLGVATGVEKVAVADLNNDGYPDVLITATNGSTQGWLNDGTGFFWSLTGKITHPNDPIYPGTFGNNIGNNSRYPNGSVTNAIDDNPATAFIDVQGSLSFVVQPSRGSSIVTGISLTSVSNLNYFGTPYPEIDPLAVQVYGSTDGSHSVGLFSTNLPSFSGGQTVTFYFSNSNAYTYYQVTMTPGDNYDDFPVIADVALLETNSLPGNITGLSLADVNADGKLDACIMQNNGQFAVWNNNGSALFSSSSVASETLGTMPAGVGHGIGAGDFDHNGALSLVTVGTGGIELLRNVNLVSPADSNLPVSPSAFSNTFAAFASNSLGQITFLALPQDGTLQANGTAIVTGSNYSVATLANLQWAPPAYFAGGFERFNWRGNSADNLVKQTNTTTFVLTHVIYPPVAANYAIDVVRADIASNFVGGATSVLANDFDPNGGTLSVSVQTPPAHGALTLNPDGTFLYAQDNSEASNDSFTYLLTSSKGATNVGTVSISIDLYTTRPLATNQSLVGIINTPINFTLTGSDPNGDSFSYSILTSPTNGVLSGTRPNLTYTPNAGQFGVDRFTFDTYDDLSNSSPATVFIVINPLPVTSNLSFTITNPGPFPLILPGFDALKYPLSFQITDLPTNGQLSGNGSNWTYQANGDFHGADGFTFTVSDPYSNSASGVVSLAVQSAFPTTTNLSFVITNPAPLMITLPGLDAANVPLAFSISSAPTNGSVTGTSSNWVYEPNPISYGQDVFSFVVSDPYGNTASGTVSILDQSTTLWVTNVADPGAGTLRAAIAFAGNPPAPGPWTIQFAPQLAGKSAQLALSTETIFGYSALLVTNFIIIDGATAPGVSISAASFVRLFHVTTNGNLTLRNVILSGGYASGASGVNGSGGGGGGGGFGGAIYNEGTLQVSNVTFFNNIADGGPSGAGAYYGSTGGSGGGVNAGAGGADLGTNASSGGLGGFGSGGGGGGGLSLGGGPGIPGFGGGQGGGSVSQTNTGSYGGPGGFGAGGGGSALSGGGGGAAMGGAIFNRAGTVQIASSLFAGNAVYGGVGYTAPSEYYGSNGFGYGAAIFNYNGVLDIVNTRFTNNTADNGAAIYNVGDGVTSTVFETNLVFSDFGKGADEASTAINNGTATLLPQLEYSLSDNSLSSATLNIFSAGSSNQITGVTQGSIGNVTFNSTSVTYTQVGVPTTNDQFTLTITNGAGASYVATVKVFITIVNYPPVANNIIVSAYRGYPITINPLTNCFDPQGYPLAISSISSTPIGIASYTSTNITYYENGNVASSDSFTYTISDGHNRATATITVNFLPFVLTVTNIADSGPGTLRAALSQANMQPKAYLQFPQFLNSPVWTIEFDPSLARQTIALSSVAATDFGPSALSASYQANIDGSDAPGLTIALASNAPPMRLFDVTGWLALENLTVRGGLALGQDQTNGSIDGLGGAVLMYSEQNFPSFNASNVWFLGNEAIGAPGQANGNGGMGAGGAIYVNGGNAFLQDCIFSSNSAIGGAAGPDGGAEGLGLGGAIYLLTNYASVSVTSTIITNNVANQGGGIYNNSYLSLDGVDISNPQGGTNLVNDGSYGYADISAMDSNYIASQTLPWLSSVSSHNMTNHDVVHFTVTAALGDTNYSLAVYLSDVDTEDELPDSEYSLTNIGSNYTLTLNLTNSCRSEAVNVYLALSEGNQEYDTAYNATNFVPLEAANFVLQTDKNTELTSLGNITNSCGTFPTLKSVITNQTAGHVTLNSDGTFNYDPVGVFPYLQSGQSVTDSFDYVISDAMGDMATGIVQVVITGEAPWIAPITDIITNGPFAVALSVSPPTLGGGYSVTAASANTNLVISSNLAVSNSVLSVTPTPGQDGSALITVTVNDTGIAASTSFLLIVPSSVPVFIGTGIRTNGFHFEFTGLNDSYTILGSTNLVQWIPIGSALAVGSNEFQFTDTNRFPARFYRLRSP